MTTRAVWHEGERALHERLGVGERMAEAGPRLIRDFMPDQHREFFAQLPFVVLGSVDDEGRPWAGVLAGQPGFLSSPDPRTLEIAVLPERDDPLHAGVDVGAPLGLLGIEPHTRRRNRMNGHITALDRDRRRATIAVEQSFGNCPKYIRPRRLAWQDVTPRPPEHVAGLDQAARDQITEADTAFVASYVELGRGRQVDVSHRGGPPGFVHVDAEPDVLTIPDYVGNRFFNTLGNLAREPRVCLLFVDFARGDLLHVSGEAQLLLDADDPHVQALPGAERAWRVQVRACVRRPGALPLREQG